MIPMLNTYDTIRESLHFNKFTVGGLLFVEYKCPIDQDIAGVWAPMDYFIHVLQRQEDVADNRWNLGRGKGPDAFLQEGRGHLLN